MHFSRVCSEALSSDLLTGPKIRFVVESSKITQRNESPIRWSCKAAKQSENSNTFSSSFGSFSRAFTVDSQRKHVYLNERWKKEVQIIPSTQSRFQLSRIMALEASEFAAQDFISIMPDNVNFFEYLLKTGSGNNYGKIISRLLLHLKGVIAKFVLSVDEHASSILDREDIEHWFLFLSRNGVKDLTLWKRTGPPLMLPTHFFSCLELKHLKLFFCVFIPPASFHGFPNLKTLELDLVILKSSELGKFISRCPLLEILNMRLRRSLLVGCLPKLEELDLDFVKCKFTQGDSKRRSPTAFPCLKALKLSRIDLGNGIMVSCAFELIKSFPNLQTLEITSVEYDAAPAPIICSPEVDHNTTALLQLRSVVFTYLKGSENEVCLIKYLLASSPFLKKIEIRPHSVLVSDEKFMFATKLLKLHRASQEVDIDLY
ncbi:hypothetical protein L1987_57322 [Smallanthus sonchifolius]|uniref:Uncharacterized protein n=1 Tax=Smallanthus sonchifolius TaxID=185202 RepID=A0ACB9DCP4_9ASTR|nr:hypothetical protein L1987_87033 [Smallanthus sonchifolius]KAI3744245.1 hypothetical protein L1987_57322 [Smallanthus sonchifolius]